MKKIFLIMFLFLVGTVGISGTSQAYSNVSLSLSFHDALAPYGTWFSYSNYGNVWRPRAHAGWSPYTQGHWVYTSYGPMWDTPEPYGWATYHYGQWVFSASYGWIWVPGYDYYPSQVSWAYGDNYLGWSPIYPAPSYGNVNAWFFIDRNHWGYNDYSNVILRGDRVRPLFDRRAVQIRNARLDRRDFERFAGRPVQVVPVEQRFVEADNHRVKLIVPKQRAQAVERELTRAHERRIANREDRENRNSQVVERRDSKGNRVFENRKDNRTVESKNNRQLEVRNKSNDRHGNSEVTTKYSGKKLITKPSSKSKSFSSTHKSNDQQIPKNMISKQSSKKSHEASVKYSSKSSKSKAPVNYSNRYSSKSHEPSKKSYSSKSSPREVSRKQTVKQSPQKNHVVESKYSSSHRPDMKQSSKQVNQASRKEVHSSKAQKSSTKQNRKPPKKH